LETKKSVGCVLVPFWPQTMALIAEQDTNCHAKNAMPTWHVVDIAVAFLNINDDIQQCSSLLTEIVSQLVSQLTAVLIDFSGPL